MMDQAEVLRQLVNRNNVEKEKDTAERKKL